MLDMDSRKTLVDRAITFARPERVPVVFWNCDQTEGDLMLYHLSLGRPGDGDPSANAWDWSVNEWGYKLESSDDGTMGYPVEPYWPGLPAAGEIEVPPLRERDRMAASPAFFVECGDRYRLASLDLSGFTVYTLLRGFENAMEDFLVAPDQFAAVMDSILDFECQLIAMAARHGFHGIHFADDWGTQCGLMISPDMWRRLFKASYQRQFERAHQVGLDVWYHCCGDLIDIAEDFHEIGVDVLNPIQPECMDVYEIKRKYGKNIKLWGGLGTQQLLPFGSPDDVRGEIRRLIGEMGAGGGYILASAKPLMQEVPTENAIAVIEEFTKQHSRRIS